MPKMSDNPSPSLLFEDHLDPAAPSDGFHRLFVDTDEKLKMIDHASLVTDFTPTAAGDITTDVAWAALGDLIVGTGNNTAAILTAGADGLVLTADDGEATGLKWAAAAGGGTDVWDMSGWSSAYDDDWTALSGWTTVGTIDVLNVTDAANKLHMQMTTAGTYELLAQIKTAPTPPFAVEISLLPDLGPSSVTYGIVLAETSPGKLLLCGPASYQAPKFARAIWTNPTTRSDYNADTVPSYASNQTPTYVRVVVTSTTNVDIYYSMLGLIWRISTTAMNPGFTIDKVGPFMAVADSSGKTECVFGPIRFNVGSPGQTWNGTAWITP
jgi:hypothetical protein